MFDPIIGPADSYSGPSTGLSTEKGDSWHGAVAKINTAFERIKKAFEVGFEHIVEAIDIEARAEIAALKERIESLVAKIEALEQAAIKPETPAS